MARRPRAGDRDAPGARTIGTRGGRTTGAPGPADSRTTGKPRTLGDTVAGRAILPAPDHAAEEDTSAKRRTLMSAHKRQTTGRQPAVGRSPTWDATSATDQAWTDPPRGARPPDIWEPDDAGDEWASPALADAWEAAEGADGGAWRDPDDDWAAGDWAAGDWAAAETGALIPLDAEQGAYAEDVSRITGAPTARALVGRPRHTTLAGIGQAAMALSRNAASRATLVPGKRRGRPSPSLYVPRGGHRRLRRVSHPVLVATACAALLVAIAATGVASTGALRDSALASVWHTGTGVHALPTPIGGFWAAPVASGAPAAPAPNDAGHYVSKYGFDWPSLAGGISGSERQRMEQMLPFALAATARYDARFHVAVEPQLLLFWTHAEGIGAMINYSNCANEGPPGGYSYFTWVGSCDTPSFWQLGYGNQFGVIDILKTSFRDMRGDPNDPAQVQRVGQAVLDWDRRQGTSPQCGGYACTFPAMTIDQIMSGVSLSHWTTDDWWASVLSRDPAINCYMLVHALIWFNHAATRDWIGCYYAEPCWGYESNSLGDILAAWPGLRRDAGV